MKTVQQDCSQLGGKVYVRPEGSDQGTIADVLTGWHLPPPWLEPKLIFDLGSYAGYTTRDFALRYPEAKVIGVELDDENFRIARMNTSNLANAETLWAGVVSFSHPSAFATYSRNPLGQNAHRLDPNGIEHAPAISLDGLIGRYGLPDYIKMDIEGAELGALSGFDLPCCINVECHDGKTDQVRSLLLLNGYSIDQTPTTHPDLVVAWKK